MINKDTAHPVLATEVGRFNTVTGEIIDIHNPVPSMFNIVDIASGLSKVCRFGGQCKHFYSVAQHSVFVASMCPQPAKLEGLMHDATEAYIGDIIKPLKNILGDSYRNIEKRFEEAIAAAFNLSADHAEVIKYFDGQALEVEAELLLFDNPVVWDLNMRTCDLPTKMLTPEEAKAEFIKAFGKYRR